MHAASIFLIALCASTSILAAPVKYARFGFMTDRLSKAGEEVATWVREPGMGHLRYPDSAQYYILHEAANAKLFFGAPLAFKNAKADAEFLITELRAMALDAHDNKENDVLSRHDALEALRSWNNVT
ncbi:hypothetical protein FRB98_008760 [Tulasnella sp. 332]|nr:hypothetical protein FRB98_008760 [Tulasnella sp. 332]